MKSPFRRVPLALGALLALACQDPKPTTGSLVVDISGLPAGGQADVRVTGPNKFDQFVPVTTTLEDLEPGEYSVSISPVTHSNALFTTVLTQQQLNVTAGKTQTSSIPYLMTGGSIDLTITGLPIGIPPNVQLTGPNGFSRSVLTSGVQPGVPAGQYTIRADTLLASDGDRYGAATFQQTVNVTASTTAVPASISYGVVSGTLNISVSGLPAPQNPAPITITGPGGFLRTTSVTTSLRGLVAGDYTITAAKVGNCPSVFAASQEVQGVTVAASATTNGSVTYAEMTNDPASLNLKVEGGYAVQVAQDFAGTVPMIAGKRALLRVFGVSNQCNSALPKVRVTLSDGTVHNLNLGAGEASLRLSPDQGSLAASYNVELPVEKVQNGLTFVAEIDPDNEIVEANETDNRFPAAGTKAVPVRTMTPTGIKLVPITIAANGSTGAVNLGNIDQFMETARRLHPVISYDVELREPLTTGKPAFQANDQNGSWGSVLNELNAIRVADASNRYYAGIVKVTYSSGVAGIGYIGNKASLNWDFLPSASGVLAHELGHNFGRQHTPCGGPFGVDPQWPTGGFYTGGFTGSFGYDFTDGTVKNPQAFTDIMGYCNNQWISDYTYKGMLDWLSAPERGPTLPMIASAPEPSILVWGRVVNGEPILEPAFEVSARPVMPAPGAHRLAAVGADGRELFAVNFAGDRIADLPGEQETFAFTVPKSMLRGRALASLRLTTRSGRSASSVQSVDVASDPGMTLTRVNPRAMRLRWNADRFPVVMVRNPATGNIIAFARGGEAMVATEQDELEMNYSNRVRSIRELRRPR